MKTLDEWIGVDLLKEGRPETLEEAVEQHPYLAEYLKGLDKEPEYYVRLDLAVGEVDEPNLIYPLGRGVFIHVERGGEIGRYNLIEPPAPTREVLNAIERAIARMVASIKELEIPEDQGEKEKILVSLFERVQRDLEIADGRREYVLYHFLREKIRHGFLEGFLEDPWLEDIGIPGAGNIFVYHRLFGNLMSNIVVSEEEVDNLLRSIAERYGKNLSYMHPIIDIHLPDGSRFNIVFGEDISLKGSNFTIRKFPREPISVAHLCRFGTIDEMLAAYMWMILDVGVSCFFCGETASGKTTSLNAFLGLVRTDAKIVSIEETPEVNLFHKNWVREVTRMHTGSVVTMFDLLKAALRQRPDYIIVGEIRGGEGRIAFQAIETGHPVVSTMHAGTLSQLFQRLTSDPINVPRTHIDSLNLTVFQARMERGRKLVRRVTSVMEIIGYDVDEGRLNHLPVFLYDADDDSLRFMETSYLLETRVLPYRGWGKERLPELYDEMERRADIIRCLKERYPSYADVWRTVIAVERSGVDSVYERAVRGKPPWTAV
jgi:flagellar protein FlaI